ncbi:MAG: serine/threonine phosphatase [Hydrococcus sp. RU_2_2]|nr:serine/threonine phosphatase [Hydrococcus sp. RU_2_2]NJP17815.1 serine/threonine phosphatase [Hydrococcus sp. CRU_1_1]
MLVCPQCQFENPNNHRFCQRCGTSLTHKPCHECGTTVPLSTETCPNCGAFTGTVWLAILVEQGEIEPQKSGEYLDLGRRYRLIASNGNTLTETVDSNPSRQVSRGEVIDCQPLQKSVLGILLEQQAEISETLEDSQPSNTSLWQRIGIPELAKPYLALQERFASIPVVHDAWQEDKKEVILIEDRSNWQLLTDWWKDKQASIADIIAGLKEIASLWDTLAKAGLSKSLLIEENLRVDGEHRFGLGQLYQNSSDSPPTLQDLGKTWEKLLEKSKLEKFELLTQLLDQLESGTIENIAELRLKLVHLSQKQQMEAKTTASSFAATQSAIAVAADENPPQKASSADEPTTEKLVNMPPVEPEDSFDSGPMSTRGASEGEDLSTAVLPMELLSLTDGGYTDRGRSRHHNEDYFGMRSQVKKQLSSRGKKYQARGLYIVCDGMGGHAAGEVASAMAVETLQRYFIANWHDDLPDRETIEKGILLTNETIFNINQKNSRSGNGRMGTTLVMALVQDTKVAFAHVGDSRIYRVTRKGGLEQLTIDHEVGQRAIQGGVAPEIAYARPDAYQLTQALGPHGSKFIKPDVHFLELQEDSLFLLCSDGLSDNALVENHWQTYLTPLISSSSSLDKGLRKLIDLANQHNGHDNITAILIRMKLRPYLGSGNW